MGANFHLKAIGLSAALALFGTLAMIAAQARLDRSTTQSELFCVVGGDYISPLITSPRGLQTLNVRMSDFGRFAGYDQLQTVVNRDGETQLATLTRFCGDLLTMLGAEFLLDGRAEVEDRRVFLSEAFWRSNFDIQAEIIGQSIQLGNERYEIAGIIHTPDSHLGETDLWVPICSRGPYGDMTSLRVVGELKAGRNWQEGERELAALMRIEIVKDQVVELDTVRLLPIDRRVYFYASSTASKLTRAI